MSAATQARALVTSILNGDLDEVTHTAQPHEPRVPSPYLTLRASPCASVVSVTIDGSALDASAYSVTPFHLTREDRRLWPASRILITYTTGWPEGYEPESVQQALALAEEWFGTHPASGVTSFREGNESFTRGTEAPNAIRALLRGWVRP